MNMQAYISSLALNPPVYEAILTTFLTQIGFTPPSDYLDFMRSHNGGEGPIGENGYAGIWKMEELIEANEGYQVEVYAPGYFVFGSDMGGTAYAFNKQDKTIVAFDFIGMLSDPPAFIVADFTSFLAYLYTA